MQTVFISSRGTVREVEVVSATKKGWKVRSLTGYKPVFLVFVRCPFGNHRTYEDRGMAVANAKLYVVRKEIEAKNTLANMRERRAKLEDKVYCPVCSEEGEIVYHAEPSCG